MVILDTGYGVHGVGSLFPERSQLVDMKIDCVLYLRVHEA